MEQEGRAPTAILLKKKRKNFMYKEDRKVAS